MQTEAAKRPLIELLKLKALRRLPAPVQLASGEWSSEFVDGKEGLADYPDLELACKTIVQQVRARGIQFDAVGGLTLGADALAVGVAAVARCKWFFVRKEPKNRGTGRLIEGAQIKTGTRVLLLDDVVTSGGSILRAFDEIVKTGAQVVAASTLVDRGDTAGEEFKKRGVPYFPMATYMDLEIPPVGHGAVGSPSPR
jgi:orotate phosphoribosyltransferase